MIQYVATTQTRYIIVDHSETNAMMEKLERAVGEKAKAARRSSPKGVFSGRAEVAQLVEQPIRNRQVPGSSPGLGSRILRSQSAPYFNFCSHRNRKR